MRDYSKVAPSFWTGRTGKRLRGDLQAQIVALYLQTCPHANMIGVFHCPIIYIAHETGLPIEGASKALARLLEEGFCTFDEELELMWVHEMARFQVGESLKASDNRVAGICADYLKMPQGLIREGFFRRYRDAFHLPDEPGQPSPSEAPPKPLRSQKQEQEQKKEQEEEPPVGPPATDAVADAPAELVHPPPSPRRGTRLSKDWELTDADAEFAAKQGFRDDEIDTLRDEFRDYWTGVPGQRGCNLDWSATWRNNVRRAAERRGRQTMRPGGAGNRYEPSSFAEAAMRAAARRS